MVSNELNNTNPPVDASNDIDLNLYVLLDHAHAAFARTHELELAQYGLSLEQAAILHTLHLKGGSATNAEIADIMNRQYNSSTTLISRMEKVGLVKKEKLANERKIMVSLTPKGKSMYDRVTANSIHMALEDLSLEDKEKLASYLEHIVAKSRHMLGLDQKLPFLS